MTNRDFFIQMCKGEHPRFLGVMQAAQADGLDYRPHPRSRSARELIAHLLGHEQDLIELATTGDINHRNHVEFTDLDDAVRIYREAHASLVPAMEAMDEGHWDAMGKFILQGTTLMEAPRRDLGWMMLMDAVHHRGQLSTYLRPMGGTVPSIYGPSADTMMAKA